MRQPRVVLIERTRRALKERAGNLQVLVHKSQRVIEHNYPSKTRRIIVKTVQEVLSGLGILYKWSHLIFTRAHEQVVSLNLLAR